MSKKSLFVVLLSFSCLLLSCKKDDTSLQEQPGSSLNKIMPLGASRVQGARPFFESYRYELWKQLVDGQWDFDYIGTMTDISPYPSYANLSFDTDHEGRGGWTSGQILTNIGGWLEETGPPDIVLFSSPGGNDILSGSASFDQAVANINEIIDIIQADNPNVTIVIEELAPGMTSIMTQELTANFNLMKAEVVKIASEQTTSTSSVITVDMHTGFGDQFLADDVHYNEAGAKFIADRYYEKLVTILKSE